MDDGGSWEFQTPRLWIRPLTSDDEDLYIALFTDALTMQFIAPALSVARAQRSFRAYLRSSRSAREWLFLALIDKSSEQPFGICTIQQLDERRRRAEAGIMLKPAVHGRGFAKEGLAAVVGRAFAVLPIDEVWLEVAAANAVVQRVALSVGFTRGSSVAAGETTTKYNIWSATRDSWVLNGTSTEEENDDVQQHRFS